MNIFGQDAIIGNFQLSTYGLMLASFETSSSDEDLGMSHKTIEEYIGNNPVPVYLGDSFDSKLKPRVTIVKGCNNKDKIFNSFECREILRQLTGFSGYKEMKILTYDFEDFFTFNIRVTNVAYKKAGAYIVGIILDMECDSQFAWSNEFKYVYEASPNKDVILFNNSDDLYHYLLPHVTIEVVDEVSEFSIVNILDNNWTTTFDSLYSKEIITMDSQKEILYSNKNRIIGNDFNMHFIRLKHGKNIFKISHPSKIIFRYKLPRKVGFI